MAYITNKTIILDLIKFRPEKISRVFIDKVVKDERNTIIIECAKMAGIPVIYKTGMRSSVCLEFKKKIDEFLLPGSHVVLIDPDIPRNVGAIIRSLVAFGVHDIAIIGNKIDTYSSSLMCTSRGARLLVRCEYFSTIGEYIRRFPNNIRYALVLDISASKIGQIDFKTPCSLVLGNETLGLPCKFVNLCNPIFIEQSNELDSLNVSVAAGIVLYEFSKQMRSGK